MPYVLKYNFLLNNIVEKEDDLTHRPCLFVSFLLGEHTAGSSVRFGTYIL